MSISDCMKEFDIPQKRAWGDDWGSKPIARVASCENLDWY